MIERYALHDKRGRITAYVMRETSHRPAAFSQAPQPRPAESPTVEAICRLVGTIMLVTTGFILWLMTTAT
jgi:hypothetical protein